MKFFNKVRLILYANTCWLTFTLNNCLNGQIILEFSTPEFSFDADFCRSRYNRRPYLSCPQNN